MKETSEGQHEPSNNNPYTLMSGQDVGQLDISVGRHLRAVVHKTLYEQAVMAESAEIDKYAFLHGVLAVVLIELANITHTLEMPNAEIHDAVNKAVSAHKTFVALSKFTNTKQ